MNKECLIDEIKSVIYTLEIMEVPRGVDDKLADAIDSLQDARFMLEEEVDNAT